jgi:hypothetical protein
MEENQANHFSGDHSSQVAFQFDAAAEKWDR